MNHDPNANPTEESEGSSPPPPPPPAPTIAGAPTGAEQLEPGAAPITLADLQRERARAEAAEARAESLALRITELESALTQAREALDAVERRQRIDRALLEADALDLESARLLTELALTAEARADIDGAVADLRRRKPFLFRARSGRAAPASRSTNDDLTGAAEHAARTGDRRALLRYLELRRRT